MKNSRIFLFNIFFLSLGVSSNLFCVPVHESSYDGVRGNYKVNNHIYFKSGCLVFHSQESVVPRPNLLYAQKINNIYKEKLKKEAQLKKEHKKIKRKEKKEFFENLDSSR